MRHGPIENVVECFEDVEDARVEGRCAHRLTAIMGVALCAIISGADNWVEVEQYGQAKERIADKLAQLRNRRRQKR